MEAVALFVHELMEAVSFRSDRVSVKSVVQGVLLILPMPDSFTALVLHCRNRYSPVPEFRYSRSPLESSCMHVPKTATLNEH